MIFEMHRINNNSGVGVCNGRFLTSNTCSYNVCSHTHTNYDDDYDDVMHTHYVMSATRAHVNLMSISNMEGNYT